MKSLRVISVVAAAIAALTPAAAAAAHTGPAHRGPAPGTATRPVLSAAEAAPYTAADYFRWSGLYSAPVVDPWRPTAADAARAHPDLVVGAAVGRRHVTHTTVQAAVNAAFRAGGTARRYIEILPGTYTGTVFIPAGTPPLTVFGAGPPKDVRLEMSLDAIATPAQWAAQVNPSGQYVDGDPAWAMYLSCATRTTPTIGQCATVVWAQSTDLVLRGLTITNTLLDTVDSGTHQAIALRTDADRTQLVDMRLISRQDTFLANANDSTRIARVLVRDSYIEGDTDFAYGRAATVYEHTEFRIVSSRKPANGVIFAPNTAPNFRFGILVEHCLLTTDAGYAATPTAHLGRAWDQGASATGYVPGSTPNGQLVIRDSYLGRGFDTVAPWAAAATTSRPFAARVDPGRDLDDIMFNRLWEFHNVGPSAV